ncbi:RNA polymerase sigma factor [Pseudotamlana agarivorans]|uniref:RNA polymerase sigma factor n=1 Tax=Pseudotamlana agarivorans TaxID=481183 RepID=UPI0008320330|nr:RNA polymerase sigma-70 factor [Tamlana agarivorans]
MEVLLNDSLLASEIKKSNREAFKTLFERYYKNLLDYIVTYTHDLQEAEDIVQLTFISLWNNRANLNYTKSIKSYIYRIAYNTYIDVYRKQKKKDAFFNELKEQALRDRFTTDPEALEKRIIKLQKVIDRLPEKCREILYLNKFEGLKYKEISERLDISVKTVESHMYTAFKKIRENFSDDELFLFIVYKNLFQE